VVLNQTGSTKFGIFLLLTNLVILTSISDLGIGNGAVNQIVEKNGHKEQDSLIFNVALSTLLTSSAIGLITIIIVRIFPVYNLFKIPVSSQTEFSLALYIAIVSYSFMPLSTLPNKIYLAQLENRKSAVYSVFTSVISNVLLISFAFAHLPLWTFVIAQTFLPVLIGIYTIKFRILKRRETVVFKWKFDYQSIVKNLGFGRVFLVLQLSAVISYQIDSLIVSHYLGPEQVTTLLTTWKICSLPIMVISFGFLPIWQSSRESDMHGNRDFAFKQLWRTLRNLCFPLGLFIILFLIGGADLIRFWSSDLVKVEKSMLFYSCLWLFLYSISQPIAYMLNGLQENRFNIVSAISSTFSNVILSMYFTRGLQSPIGPLIGSSISQFLFFLFPFFLFRRRFLRKSSIDTRFMREEDIF